MNINNATFQNEVDFATSRSIQVEHVPYQKNDAVFDFNISKDKQSNMIHANILMMRDLQCSDQNSPFNSASLNFWVRH